MGDYTMSKKVGEFVKAIRKKPIILGSIMLCVVAVCIAGIILFSQILKKDIVKDKASNDSIVSTNQELPLSVGSENLIITSVTATDTVGYLIEPDTEFNLTSSKDIKPEELKARLAIKPDMPFEITRTASCSYKLRSSKAFPASSIVNLTLKDNDGNIEFSWAFQTADTFRIKSVVPADKSTYVPVTAGVEIEFSMPLDTEKAQSYFEITPQISGNFKSYRSTLVFIPDNDFETDTVYTVNIKAGMPSIDGIALSEGTKFSFKTEHLNSYMYCYSTNGISETFLPEDQALVELYCCDALLNNDYNVTLYQYNNSDEYFKSLKEYSENVSWEQEYDFSTSGLTSVYKETVKPLYIQNDYWSPAYILLPENLDEGWYLADITTELDGRKFHIQRHIQISQLSVYAGVLPKQAAFFVNDTATGKAISDASISLYINGSSSEVRTGSNGTALMNINQEKDGKGVLKISSGNYIYIDVLDYYETGESDPAEDYYTYIYTDREAYLSTDTVKIWGLIRPRTKKSAAVPSDLHIRLGYDDTENKDIPVTINKNGTFTAEISFSNLNETWGESIALMSGDTELCSKYVSIYDYVKPTYFLVPDLPACAVMPQKNPVKAGINATFFDGTPADNLSFNVEGGDISSANPAQIITNSDGYAETSVYLNDQNTWRPSWTLINFNMSGIENDYQVSYGTFYSVFRDVMLESDFSISDGKGSLKITTSKVNTNAITDSSVYYEDEQLRGAPADTEVTAVLKRSYQVKTETGSYYDFLEKKTVKKYDYDYREETIGTYTIKTVNGKGEFSDLPMEHDDSSYYMELSWKDTNGQLVQDTAYLYDRYNYYNSLSKMHYFTLSADSKTFAENQKLNFKLLDNFDEASTYKGRIFYTVTSSEFLSLNIADSANFSHTMTADYIPNVNISGAYFDGKHVYPIYSSWDYYYFDPSEREIKLTITADKDEYAPGDTAKFKIKACDINGKPISAAAVSLSVVDEAAFAIAPQNANPLSNIYSTVWYPQITAYCSYIQHSLEGNGGAEKGGGDGETSIRKDFKDTAAFLSGVTSSDGTAEFTVALPDNLTTWRATAQAVGDNSDGALCAGTSKLPVVVTQPLFITPVVLSEYLVGDDISVLAFCNGKVDGKIDVTASINVNGQNCTGTVPSGMPINFGKLPKGSYKILFTASDGKNSDSIELPFEVKDTLLEMPVVRTFELTGNTIDIAPTRWPVNITFYNKDYILYSQILNNFAYSYSQRLDLRIAQGFAYKELGYTSEEEYINSFGGINSYGLAKLLPYSEGDCELTALICAAAPELVNKKSAVTSFNTILSQPDTDLDDITSCYLGLAAMSEPVLSDVNRLLENNSSLSCNEKLKLCAALALLGDYQNAVKYYNKATSDISIYKDNGEAMAFVNGGDDIQGSTKLALITASVLDLPEAEGMARYLANSKQTDQSFALELMTYLRHYTPKSTGSKDAEIQYTLDGKTQTLKINRYYGSTLKFGEEQLKNANFKVLSGNVCATACYTGQLSEQQSKPSIQIKKTMTSVSGDWKPGALVKVTLVVSGIEEKYFRVNDVVPSGARYVYSDTENYYVERSGQRIKIASYDKNTVEYYIRLVTPGQYVCENAVVRDSQGNWGSCERDTMVVEDK